MVVRERLSTVREDNTQNDVRTTHIPTTTQTDKHISWICFIFCNTILVVTTVLLVCISPSVVGVVNGYIMHFSPGERETSRVFREHTEGQLCYSKRKPYCNFASRTRYEHIRGRNLIEDVKSPGCEPIQIFFVERHGSRFPHLEIIDSWLEFLPALQRKISASKTIGQWLCQEDVELLKGWKEKTRREDAELVADSGYRQLNEMGARVRAALPKLLDRPYSNTIFNIRFLKEKRTRRSAVGFFSGLFKDHEDLDAIIADVRQHKIMKSDRALRFFDACERYRTREDQDAYKEQMDRYLNEADIGVVVRDVTRRLGLSPGELSPEDVHMLWDKCRYDSSNYGDSPWCIPFLKDDLDVFEYYEDLKLYYRDGYADTFNYEITCEFYKEMMGYFSGAMERTSPSGPVGAFRFARSQPMVKLITSLGLFKDNYTLFPDNYKDVLDRKWRTHVIDSFGNNLLFLLYQCGDKYSLKAFKDEKEFTLDIAGCSTSPCDIDLIKKAWGNYLDNCDFDSMCKV